MIERPVYLLHNPTGSGIGGNGGIAEDLAESALDRTWPALYINGMPAQHNKTTRNLAYILYNEPGPITIVSHSQGTLITRNALLTIALLGKENKARKEIAWTATGMPMQNSEIWPKPDEFELHVNPNDEVAALVGTRGGGHTIEAIEAGGVTHNPMCNYFPRIYNFNDDPTDYRLTKGAYKAFYNQKKT